MNDSGKPKVQIKVRNSQKRATKLDLGAEYIFYLLSTKFLSNVVVLSIPALLRKNNANGKPAELKKISMLVSRALGDLNIRLKSEKKTR